MQSPTPWASMSSASAASSASPRSMTSTRPAPAAFSPSTARRAPGPPTAARLPATPSPTAARPHRLKALVILTPSHPPMATSFLLADFMAGCVSTNNAYIAEGNQKRTVYENTWDIFAQDAWQVTPKLNINYGLRYDYAQVRARLRQGPHQLRPRAPRRLRHPGRQRREPLQPLQGIRQPAHRRILLAVRRRRRSVQAPASTTTPSTCSPS